MPDDETTRRIQFIKALSERVGVASLSLNLIKAMPDKWEAISKVAMKCLKEIELPDNE